MLLFLGLTILCVVGAGLALYLADRMGDEMQGWREAQRTIMADHQELRDHVAALKQQVDEVTKARDDLVSFMAAMRASEELNQQAISRVYKALDANGFDGFKE